MNINYFISEFNLNIRKINDNLTIKEIKNKEEANCKAMIINTDISALSYETDSKLTGITIISAGKTVQEAVNTLIVISIVIDTFTGQQQEWRNNIIERLGMFNGDFAKGKTTENRGYKFKVAFVKGKIMLAISKNKTL